MNPEQATPPRFIIGIDLGTTNCAVSFVDTRNDGRSIQDFAIRQFTAPEVLEQRDTLPSFLYALTDAEKTTDDLRIDANYRVGIHARDHGALTPGRLVASAKSWLCHGGVDREAGILPWHAQDGVQTVSPVAAQAIILKHLRAAWDEQHPDHPMAGQDVFITVPASFDEVARELTVRAAKAAGILSFLLLEEPQAAFYAWLSRHEDSWTNEIKPDDHILVCDVGGGTTDLTLIHARPGENGEVNFHRTAVGEHLILGGDNLDHALAHELERDLAPASKLDPRAWSILVRLCRHYKEHLLSEQAPDSVGVSLPGTGSGLLRNQRTTQLTRERAELLLLDGFLPLVDIHDKPVRRASGFREFGLPYAPDHAITRYLADFLATNLPRASDGSIIPPGAVLLNGGLFESPAMRSRMRKVLQRWFGAGDEWQPKLLDHRRLDLAVARGAAYFGLVRRGRGVNVVSNLARTYYMGVDVPGSPDPHAMCIASAGMPAGQSVVIANHPIRAQLKTPVQFPLYVSSRRTTDAAGDITVVDSESFTPLPPIRTVLTAGKQAVQGEIDVSLRVALSELGTLDLAIQEKIGSRAWKLEFDLRAATRPDLAYHEGEGEQAGIVESGQIEQASDCIVKYFALGQSLIASTPIMKELEATLGSPRHIWPASVLRSLWSTLMMLSESRSISAAHEQRWLNLTGYSLRPGFGLALDDWRVAETWKVFHSGMAYPSNEAVRAEWWILWRRLAGGMSAGQQKALAQPILSALLPVFEGRGKPMLHRGRELKAGSQEFVEVLRLVSSLEHLDTDMRQRLGDALLKRIGDKGPQTDHGACVWALGRIGIREPVYGSMHQVLPADVASGWIRTLCRIEGQAKEMGMALVNLGRLTGDRYIDIPDDVRILIVAKLEAITAGPHLIQLVREGGRLGSDEQELVFGEKLPRGLTIQLPAAN